MIRVSAVLVQITNGNLAKDKDGNITKIKYDND
jgi:hypothetical protein